MPAEKFTKFDYLLNAMTEAGRQEKPAEHGYGEKRRKLYEHVRELERRAAAYDALASHAPAAPKEQAYWCKKCGYRGSVQVGHQRPNGSGECGYIASTLLFMPRSSLAGGMVGIYSEAELLAAYRAGMLEAAKIAGDMPIAYERDGHLINTHPEDYEAAIRRAAEGNP